MHDARAQKVNRSRIALNFNSRFPAGTASGRGGGGGGNGGARGGGMDGTEIHKLRIFRRAGGGWRGEGWRRWQTCRGVWRFSSPSPLASPPKFRNILRVSAARRGFNGARSTGTNWNFYVSESVVFLSLSLSLSLSLFLSPFPPSAPPRSRPTCVCARSLRFRGLEPGRAFIPISFYYRLRNRALRGARARVRNSRGRAEGTV